MSSYRPITLLLIIAAFGPLRAGAQAQETSEYTARHLDELRIEYLLYPELAELRLSRRSTGRANAPFSSRSRERLLNEMELLARRVSGQSFLAGNQLAAHVLDSLRIDFFNSPTAYPENRLSHLDFASQRTTGQPFARGQPRMMELLRTQQQRFFENPGAFDSRRLEELERVSLKVSALPFLRGSPALVALIERARMEYADNPATFSPSRLKEIDSISIAVTGQPFRRSPYGTYGTLVLAAIVLGSLTTIWIRRRNRTRSRGSDSDANGRPKSPMTVQEACEILHVQPDGSLGELTRAYRKLQKQYHPDLVTHLGPEIREAALRKTTRINEAYKLLRRRAGSERSGE